MQFAPGPQQWKFVDTHNLYTVKWQSWSHSICMLEYPRCGCKLKENGGAACSFEKYNWAIFFTILFMFAYWNALNLKNVALFASTDLMMLCCYIIGVIIWAHSGWMTLHFFLSHYQNPSVTSLACLFPVCTRMKLIKWKHCLKMQS